MCLGIHLLHQLDTGIHILHFLNEPNSKFKPQTRAAVHTLPQKNIDHMLMGMNAFQVLSILFGVNDAPFALKVKINIMAHNGYFPALLYYIREAMGQHYRPGQ